MTCACLIIFCVQSANSDNVRLNVAIMKSDKMRSNLAKARNLNKANSSDSAMVQMGKTRKRSNYVKIRGATAPSIAERLTLSKWTYAKWRNLNMSRGARHTKHEIGEDPSQIAYREQNSWWIATDSSRSKIWESAHIEDNCAWHSGQFIIYLSE